ncbi:zf-CCHC domain-containing protein [Tanacetum coccineum]
MTIKSDMIEIGTPCLTMISLSLNLHATVLSPSTVLSLVLAVLTYSSSTNWRRGKFVCQPHDDKKNFQKVKEDKKEKDDRRCFKCVDPNHFISDCPKHSFSDQKAFVVGCWNDSEDDSKKE